MGADGCNLDALYRLAGYCVLYRSVITIEAQVYPTQTLMAQGAYKSLLIYLMPDSQAAMPSNIIEKEVKLKIAEVKK